MYLLFTKQVSLFD